MAETSEDVSDEPTPLKTLLSAIQNREPKFPIRYKTRSKVWSSFLKLDRNMAQCIECGKVLKTSGNTTNLLKHLKHHPAPDTIPTTALHDDEYEVDDPDAVDMESDIDLMHLNSPIPSPQNQEVIASARLTPTNDLSPVSEFHNDNASLPDDDLENSEVTDYLLYFLCVDKQPLNVIQGEGFKELMRKFMPLYKIPNKININRIIDDKYRTMRELYVCKFSSASYVSLACNIWCDASSCKNFLSISAFFSEDDEISSICIGMFELSDECLNSEYLCERIFEVLDRWKIARSKVVAIVTDNGDDIMNAVLRFGKGKHVPCLRDNLVLIKNCALNNTSVMTLLEKVRSIVKWVNINKSIRDELNHLQLVFSFEKNESKPRKLVLDGADNDFSICSMLNHFLYLSALINDILISKRRSQLLISALELDVIKELIMLLNPLETVTKEIYKESFMSASKIIPIVNSLSMYYSDLDVTTEIGSTVRIRIMSEIQKRFNHHTAEVSILLTQATLLDPRFKHIHFASSFITARARRAILQNLQGDNLEMANDDYDFWSHHRNLIQEKTSFKTIHSKTKVTIENKNDEFSTYLNMPMSPLSSTPQSQWNEMKSMFPALYKEAVKYFSIPASLTLAKGMVMNDGAERSQLGMKKVMKYAFLGSCKSKDWFQ